MNFYRLPPIEQRDLALERLFAYIREYVEPYHPYYRRVWREAGIDPRALRTYADLLTLPVVSKEEYRRDPRAFILQPRFRGVNGGYDTARYAPAHLLRNVWQAAANRPRDFVSLFRRLSLRERVERRIAKEWLPVHFHASTGTTGEPTPAVYTWRDLHEMIPELGAALFLQPDDPAPGAPYATLDGRTMNSFPGVPHLAFFQAVFSKLFVGVSCFDNGGGRVMSTERQIELFAKQGFNSVAAVPSYMIHWLRKAVHLRQEGRIPEMPGFRHLILGAEPASKELKRYFHELARRLGAHPKMRVLESLGSTEMRWAFLECDEGAGIHLNPRYFYWEVLHPETHQPVGPGQQGVLVFSHIDWRGTVFIRYNTGDLIAGGVTWEECPLCGYTFPRLFGPISRAKKDFTKIKGTLVPLQVLVGTVRDTEGVMNLQVRLAKEDPADPFSRDILRLRVAPARDVNRAALADRIKKRVKEATEVTPDEIIFVDDAESFEKELFQRTGVKAEYVVEERPVHV